MRRAGIVGLVVVAGVLGAPASSTADNPCAQLSNELARGVNRDVGEVLRLTKTTDEGHHLANEVATTFTKVCAGR